MSTPNIKHKYETLKTEYQICKRKLDSKCEALLILTKDLDQCRQERDQFKLMAEQVQERYQALKRQLAGVEPRKSVHNKFDGDHSTQNLATLLCEMRDVNKGLQFEVDDLKQKLNDANGDIKLLREQIARQRVGTTDEGMNTRYFPAHEREDLVKQLEDFREQFSQIERDLQQVLDEKEELVTERDVYKTKFDRLNQELNYILKGEENRIVDIDALVMDNKYLKERLKIMEEEKTIAMATVSKYKTILEKKKSKGILKLGQKISGGVVVSQSQVQQLLESKSQSSISPQMVTDLQALAGALLDTVNDKNLALSHQRKTNKILGNRVSELEKKLRTLEVSGLWNIPGASASLQKLRQECEEIKTLIPRQASGDGDGMSDTSPITSPEESPLHKPVKDVANAGLSLEDLDLLPTKDLDLLPTKDVSSTNEKTPDLSPSQTTDLPSNLDDLKTLSVTEDLVHVQADPAKADLPDDEADNDVTHDNQDTHITAESPLLSNENKQSVKPVTIDLTGVSDCLEATEESVKLGVNNDARDDVRNDVSPVSPTATSPLLRQQDSDQSQS